MAKELNRLHKEYIDVVVPAIMKEKGYKNINQVPKLEKIIVSRGLGDVKDNSQAFNKAVDELATITGQKPVTTTAVSLSISLVLTDVTITAAPS